jgi:hypothetical protein
MKLHEATLMVTGPNMDIVYTEQLIEVLSDLIDILNEAKTDGMDFLFQLGYADGKYHLASLMKVEAKSDSHPFRDYIPVEKK